ncbi:hypothetical protein [Pseudofrankia sp. DC12]|uniref:hypothetical protein n=1 Tax=Pseudofrankia sp. DC12 TaxID=683315 RepID=UPI0005F7BAEE|nr:hypothetical protein [Pseudofrankia sp. DC12]
MLYLFGQILVFVLIALVLGAALAWVFLIGPMRRQRASSAAAAPGAEGAHVTPAAGGDRPARGRLAELDEDRLGALTDWLRRQEERSTVENAELVARLAAAEQQVGESENRVSAAERQVATAVEQVGAAQARIAQIEAELRGETADGQSRETRRLRTALVEAEARAARFSARLAHVRTQVEEAALQAAAATERLDRRQAEWAAERAGLLVRIAEAETLARTWDESREPSGNGAVSAYARTSAAPTDVVAEPAASPGDDLDLRTEVADVAAVDSVDLADRADLVDGADLLAPTTGRVVALGGARVQPRATRPVSARQRTPVAALVPAGGATGPGDGGPDGTEPAAVDTAALDAVVLEILDADADARAVPQAGPSASGLSASGPAGLEPAAAEAAASAPLEPEAVEPEPEPGTAQGAVSEPVVSEAVVPEPAAEVAAAEPVGPEPVGPEAVVAAPAVAEVVASAPVVPPAVVPAAVGPEPAAPGPAAPGPAAPGPAGSEAALIGFDDPRRLDHPGQRDKSDADELVLPSWGGPAEPVPSTDNLKEIVGIGPVIEARLRTLGITSFRQLAAMGDTDVDRLSASLDGFGSRILSDDWVGQARELQTRGLEDLGY